MAEIPYAKTSSAAGAGVKPDSFHKGSTLAMGVAARLAYVGAAIAALWLCVWWALQ
jgi:hypothetical protein